VGRTRLREVAAGILLVGGVLAFIGAFLALGQAVHLAALVGLLWPAFHRARQANAATG
jgi:hypothetical protein